MTAPLRIAVLPDFREEGWISMEYCADRLLAHLPEATRLEPRYRHFATRISQHKLAVNYDRFRNRFRTYPAFLKTLPAFDRYHVVDHSYAHLVHSLPADRTGVYCHDIDAFLSVLEPAKHPKPKWFQAMSRKLLTGLQKAAIVFHNSKQTREQLLQYQLIEPERLIHAPLGVAEEFTLAAGHSAPEWVKRYSSPWILHVGSCVPRKRIDVLLDALSLARRELSGLRLVKVGGDFSAAHREQIDRLGLADAIEHRKDLSRVELAAVYRAAPLVAIPSESEGFGLPTIEALACGAAVLASDIPALREAGGNAARYLPVAQLEAWAKAVVDAFANPNSLPPIERRLEQASLYSWANHAKIIRAAYETLA